MNITSGEQEVCGLSASYLPRSLYSHLDQIQLNPSKHLDKVSDKKSSKIDVTLEVSKTLQMRFIFGRQQ